MSEPDQAQDDTQSTSDQDSQPGPSEGAQAVASKGNGKRAKKATSKKRASKKKRSKKKATNTKRPSGGTAASAAVNSAAEAAKFVRREVPVLVKGKDTGETKLVPVKGNEVLDWRDYGNHVVVVTVDGQKLEGAKK